jgi:hypothetical protein
MLSCHKKNPDPSDKSFCKNVDQSKRAKIQDEYDDFLDQN